MKKSLFSETGKVFGFSLRQTCRSKGWLISTIVIAALLLIVLPALLLAITLADNEATLEARKELKNVIVCDETPGSVDYSYLKQCGAFEDTAYTAAADMTEAQNLLTDKDHMAILRISNKDDEFVITVYLDDESSLSRSTAYAFSQFVESNFGAAKIQKTQLDPTQLQLLSLPISTEVSEISLKEAENEHSGIDNNLNMLLPFLIFMLLYMMIILYGQTVAQSILLEKTSKLMETMLVSVRPFALILGKLFAVVTAAILQLGIWLASLLGGAFAFVTIASRLSADKDESIVVGVQYILNSTDHFSIRGIIMALLFLILCFSFYLSIASIGGSLASKSEDIGKTNIVFLFIVLGSFFLCLGTPESSNTMIRTDNWLLLFPFTSAFVLPSQLLLGNASLTITLLAILIMIICGGVVVFIAAKIYQMLSLYRGEVLSPKKLWKMLKESFSSNKTE